MGTGRIVSLTAIMKNFFLTIGLFANVIISSGQEAWLQPERFFYKSGDELSIGLVAGRDFIGRSSFKKSEVNDLTLHEISSARNLLDSIKGNGDATLKYTLKSDGTYLFTLQTTGNLREFPADTFNMLVKDYELDAVRNQRQKNNSVNTTARVNKRVFGKLIIQAGEKREEIYKKVMGWPVEIIPDRNPTSLKVGDQIKFKILFDGKPVFGVRTKVWNRYDNRTTLQNIYTQQDGTIEARISSPGPWMVTVVKMIPSKDQGADWVSYQGSFVFGFD